MNHKKISLSMTLFILGTLNIRTLSACYVDLRMHDIQYYTNPDIRFHDEYLPQEEHFDQVSFPVCRCYPIPVAITNTSRWFFTSAVEGSVPYFGEAIAILNQSITHVYAVRGKTGNGNWFHVYFGLDAHNPKFANKAYRVYQGKILHIQCKDPSHIEHTNDYYSDDAKYVDNAIIDSEIKNYLSGKTDVICNRQTYFDALNSLFLKKYDAYYTYGRLISSVCYWANS